MKADIQEVKMIRNREELNALRDKTFKSMDLRLDVLMMQTETKYIFLSAVLQAALPQAHSELQRNLKNR